MDTEGKALLKRIAVEIMGWKVLEQPDGWAHEPTTVFSFDDYRPVCGTTFAHSLKVLDPGDPAFGVTWRKWNPFTDPLAWWLVAKAIVDKGFIVDLRLGAEDDRVKVSTQDAANSVAGSFAGDEPGRSLCEAVILLIDALKAGLISEER
jgi:hypothetical protein